MIEPGNYWLSVMLFLTVWLTAFNNLFKVLEELMKILPKWLKIAARFLIYSLTLVLPNIGIIWYFFYLAGFSPARFSEARFFWAMVAQPTLGVSIYAFIWGKWFYPKLQRVLGESPSQKTTGKEVTDSDKIRQPQNTPGSEQRPPRQSQKRDTSSRRGGKKG